MAKTSSIQIHDAKRKKVLDNPGYREWVPAYRVHLVGANGEKTHTSELLNDVKAVKIDILSAVNNVLKIAGCDVAATLSDLNPEYIKDCTKAQKFVKSGFATSGLKNTNPHGFVLAKKK